MSYCPVQYLAPAGTVQYLLLGRGGTYFLYFIGRRIIVNEIVMIKNNLFKYRWLNAYMKYETATRLKNQRIQITLNYHIKRSCLRTKENPVV